LNAKDVYACVKTDATFRCHWAVAVCIELRWEGKLSVQEFKNLAESLCDEEENDET
jgi:hypothetical protein